MDEDALDDLPAESRRELVTGIVKLLDVDASTAEDLVRSAGTTVGCDGTGGRTGRLLGWR